MRAGPRDTKRRGTGPQRYSSSEDIFGKHTVSSEGTTSVHLSGSNRKFDCSFPSKWSEFRALTHVHDAEN